MLASAFGILRGMSPLPFYGIGAFARPLTAEFGCRIDQIMVGLLAFGVVLLNTYLVTSAHSAVFFINTIVSGGASSGVRNRHIVL